MEIILNKQMCSSLTGKIGSTKGWCIRRIGHGFFSVCRYNDYNSWRRTLPHFYREILSLQEANFIERVILNDEEKEVLQA